MKNRGFNVRVRISFLGLVALWAVRAIAAPTNDNYAASTILTGTNISYGGTLSGATLETGEPVQAATNTVWVLWEAPATGAMMTSLPNSEWGWVAYAGDALTNLHPLPVSPIGAFGLARFWVNAGTVYHIQFFGSATSFNFNAQYTAVSSCGNDDFANAATVVGDGIMLGSCLMADATTEIGEPPHLTEPHQSLWWKWQAPRHGTYYVGAQYGLLTNLTVAVYTGNAIEALTLVGKETNASVNSLYFPVTGGNTYYIAAVAPALAIGDFRAVLQHGVFDLASRTVPGNRLLEPSWEGTALDPQHWGIAGQIGGYVNEYYGADGTTWPLLSSGAKVWQDITVVPGHEYAVQFALKNAGAQVKVWWNTNLLALATVPLNVGDWHWVKYLTIPTNGNVRITFENVGGNVELDAFSVADRTAPPAIVHQPVSASTIAGGTVAFVVGASGSLPLSYRWYFKNQSLAGQTNPVVVFDSVSTNQVGSYFVVITNSFGAITSSVVSLAVDTSITPAIVWQPYGDHVTVGGYYSFNVAAIGTAPLSYQWYLDGVLRPGAIEDTLTITNVQQGDAGYYQVAVSNLAGVAWSLPARLAVDETLAGGGQIDFRNWFVTQITNQLPVFDVDGVTPLSGVGFVAQLYAGPSLELLRPAGQPTPFQSGLQSGYFVPKVITLANVLPGSNCVAQVRVWEAAVGDSFEVARALGGKFGKSEVLSVSTGGGALPPQPLAGLQSFSLHVGLPYLATGVLSLSEVLPDGSIVWQLTGEPNSRYVIERSGTDFIWKPILVITNFTGNVIFSDTTSTNPPNFYRSRILD